MGILVPGCKAFSIRWLVSSADVRRSKFKRPRPAHHFSKQTLTVTIRPIRPMAKKKADAQASAPMVDSHENWNYLIISQFFINERFA